MWKHEKSGDHTSLIMFWVKIRCRLVYFYFFGESNKLWMKLSDLNVMNEEIK